MKERNNHSAFEIENAGLYVSTSHGYITASPDGIFKCPCHGSTVIEIKCPFSHRNKMLLDAAKEDFGFCLSVGENGVLYLKKLTLITTKYVYSYSYSIIKFINCFII
jgi:hypothetical protein